MELSTSLFNIYLKTERTLSDDLPGDCSRTTKHLVTVNNELTCAQSMIPKV